MHQLHEFYVKTYPRRKPHIKKALMQLKVLVIEFLFRMDRQKLRGVERRRNLMINQAIATLRANNVHHIGNIDYQKTTGHAYCLTAISSLRHSD